MTESTQAAMPPLNPLNAAPRLLMLLGRRLRRTPPGLVLWQAAAWMLGLTWLLSGNIPVLQWGREIVATLPAPLSVVLALRLSVDRLGDLAHQPWRFVGVLGMWELALQLVVYLLSPAPTPAFPIPPFTYMVDAGLIMVLHGPFAWLYVLQARRAEDSAHLAGLQMRRSALSRRIAHSKLMAARAQVDPEMVVRVLRSAMAWHRDDAERASALLDHLIGYLRLAMNRMREDKPGMNVELALIGAYLRLYEAETGVHIAFHAEPALSGAARETSAPLFVIVRKMFDAAAPLALRAPVLRVLLDQGRVALRLETGALELPAGELARLSGQLSALAGDTPLPIAHACAAGVHSYTIFALPAV